jgi:hypothetical protein
MPQKTLQIQLFCIIFLLGFVEFFATKFCLLLSKIIFGKMIFDEKNFFVFHHFHRFFTLQSIWFTAHYPFKNAYIDIIQHLSLYGQNAKIVQLLCTQHSHFFCLPYMKFAPTRAHVQAQACAFHIIYVQVRAY